MAKLDRLLNLTGELVISSGRARITAEGLVNVTEREQILECLADMDRLFLDLQEQVTSVRMVPAGLAFDQHRRTVRDMAEAAGKDVRLPIEGSHVEVDAAVIELIKDPLTHMIRNAVDHGIESAEARLAAGKDATGTVTLRASHDAGAILIEVADDAQASTVSAWTIAESEESCAVFGMPRAAIARGGATDVLPIEGIASALARELFVSPQDVKHR